MTTKAKTKAKNEYAYQWNLRTEKWERKKVGKGHKWEDYQRKPDGNYDDDEEFIRVWVDKVRVDGSCADVAKHFCETIRGVQAKRRALNKKLAKQLGLPDDHEVLPSLPGKTDAQKARELSHFTPKPKPLTLAEKLQHLPDSIKSVLNLPKPKSAK